MGFIIYPIRGRHLSFKNRLRKNTMTIEIEKEEEEKIVPPVEEKKDEEDDFESDSDVVSAGKYNQAVRKQREMELEKRELQKQLEDAKKHTPAKDDDDEEGEDLFGDSEDADSKISSLVDAKVKPILERLHDKEVDERKRDRTLFFKRFPEYMKSENWTDLLDTLDSSINPNSKDSHYKQLYKAHLIRSGENASHYSQVDKAKEKMAIDAASKGDGAEKPSNRKSSIDERADRLAQKMPLGFVYTGK